VASSLRVPEPYLRPLEVVRDLPDEDFDRLVGLLADSPPYLQVASLIDRVEATLPEGTKGAGRTLLLAVLSLRGQFRNTPISELAQLVSESIELYVEDSDARHRFAERLNKVLELEAIRSTGNAIDVLTRHDRNFHTARIFTDLRPLFADDPSEQPTGAVIVDMLQIDTWDRAGGSESLYIALDHSDLLELQGVVERALAKSDVLRDFVDRTGLHYFELDEGTTA
jgi:hypothetical protein